MNDNVSFEQTSLLGLLNDDGDDTRSKLEPRSYMEHPEHVPDDIEQKKKNEEVEKENKVEEVVKENEVEKVEKEKEVVEIVKEIIDDTSAKKNEEIVKESEVANESRKEFTDNISPTTATTSKTSVTPKQKKRSFTLKTRRLPGSIVGMCRRRRLIRSHIKTKFITREFFVEKIKEVIQHCDNIVPELTVAKTNEMLKKEMPRLVACRSTRESRKGRIMVKNYFGAEMGIFCEWKTNSIDDEASVIINP
ncbi:hypothetical protein Tco_1038137 [Tanacetum coccineum]